MSDCIKKVVSFEEFLASKEYKDVCEQKFICVLYHKLSEKPVGRAFEVDLYAIRKEARVVDYTQIKEIKNEVYLFPQEYGIILLGAYDNNYAYTSFNYYLGEFYDLLSDKQKLELQQSQSAMSPVSSVVVKGEK